jgi:phage terminase large subunit-like protein
MSLLPAEERRTLLDELSDRQAADLLYDWRFWARPEQVPPDGDWRCWLVLAGRGFGKTRTAAEWVRAEVEAGRRGRFGLIARTAADVRDVIVEGESGILATARPDFRPRYEPSKRRLTWPNGAIATTYSADEPDLLRGPQHDALVADELAAWKYPEAWDMAMLGLRLGANPRVVAATTPRPTKLIRELVDAPTTHVTRGSTYDNLDNLAPAFADQIIKRYEGTRIGRQELLAEILTDMPGALWTYAMFENRKPPPDLARVVVAIDPAATSGEDSDETGIVVAGLGVDGRGYVLGDRSCRLSPDGWARRAVAAYDEWCADRVVAEVNNGGEMVEHTIRTVRKSIPYKQIHASRGKAVRAQPVAALYEQHRVTHCEVFEDLEAQLTGWTPESGTSPDRLDALVWALTDLMLAPALRPAYAY